MIRRNLRSGTLGQYVDHQENLENVAGGTSQGGNVAAKWDVKPGKGV